MFISGLWQNMWLIVSDQSSFTIQCLLILPKLCGLKKLYTNVCRNQLFYEFFCKYSYTFQLILWKCFNTFIEYLIYLSCHKLPLWSLYQFERCYSAKCVPIHCLIYILLKCLFSLYELVIQSLLNIILFRGDGSLKIYWPIWPLCFIIL